jgi:arginine/lysine/ornithine decarboxylase
MPGHKRNLENELSSHMFQWDITEIDGFDELHDPEGIIKESMEEVQDFYGTKKTWYLVNGSSSGNMAAAGGAFVRGDGILIGRNCHRSVYQGVELFGLVPYYVYPDYDGKTGICEGISPEQIEEKLRKHPDIKGVFLTSPTYEGVVSDIFAISKICHTYGVLLIVDEAHGAHFAYSEYFPKSAVEQGADIVIQSLHKTMAVPNQGALLHLCSDRVEEEKLSRYQSMFQTTSPSYVLLASMEYGIAHGREHTGLWRQYEDMLEEYRGKWEKLSHIYLLSQKNLDREKSYDYDRGKLVFILGEECPFTGREIAGMLQKKYHLQMEMSEKRYFIAMTSYLDTLEGFLRLDQALQEIDEWIEKNRIEKRKEKIIKKIDAEEPERVYLPGEAMEKKRIWVQMENAVGKIAGNYVYLYPPGSPIFVPGEKINAKMLEKIQEYLYNDMEVKGVIQKSLCIIETDEGRRDSYVTI